MKRYILALLLLIPICMLHAQNDYWEKAKGPYGGVGTLILAPNGKLVYNNNSSGVYAYASTDGGVNWNRLQNNLVDSTALGNYTLVAGNGGNFFKTLKYPGGASRVFRSIDDGVTWQDAFSPDSIQQFVETFDGTLIGIDSTRLMRSIDGGKNWEVVYGNNSSSKVWSLSIGNNGNIWAYNGNDSLLRSQNDGQTWSRNYVPIKGYSIHVTNNGTILISSTVRIYRSSDNGLTFQEFKIDPTSIVQAGTFCTLSSGRILFTITGSSDTNKSFYSDNNGLTWFTLAGPCEIDKYHNIRLPDGTIFCNRAAGLYRSDDGGKNWQFSSKGIRAYPSKLLFASNDTIYSGQLGSLQRTFDGGENWEKISNDSCDRGKLYVLYDTKKLIFMLNERLFLSPDGGDTRIDITPPVQIGGFSYSFGNWDFNAAVSPFSKTFIVSNPLKSFRSIDEGQTWMEIPGINYLRDIQFQNDGTIYAIKQDTEVLLKSIDDGITWETAVNAAKILCVSKTNSVFVANSKGIFKWNPSAMEWVKKSSPLNFWADNHSIIISNSQGFLFFYDVQNAKISLSINEGDTWQTIPSISSLFNLEYPFSLPNLEVGPDQRLYHTTPAGMFRTSKSTLEGAFVRGNLYRDEDEDCLTYEETNPLKNWIVKAKNQYETFVNTNQQGEYVMLLDTGIYDISVAPINGIWWKMCDSLQTVALELLGESDTANFSALRLAYCPLMSVNVATPRLRRCFSNEVYVAYCNQGTEQADSAWVDVILDPYLTFEDSEQPHQMLGNHTVRFFVGNVPFGDCGQFQLTVHLDCDSSIIGQTHCIAAHGFPDTLCFPIPSWSGANIEASVACQDSVLQVILENTGTVPSKALDYIIIEDDIVLFSGQKNYAPGESLIMDYPANGHTWRIESEQEPGHPFSKLALAFAEGCGGFNSLGFINQFSVNGIQPSWHRMCIVNSGAIDPNDKQGYPLGFGSEHIIYAGQPIDYLIRFQNTGTDTAFNILLRDTLSALLDPASIRVGASSHPYTWSLSGAGIITFNFNNIMLPDSNVNEATSHGFIQFNISPRSDAPLGSAIENEAAIYFDFNTPIFTNTTWHTIEKRPQTSALFPEPKAPVGGLNIWPNPFRDNTNIQLQKKTSSVLLLKIYDSRGTLVIQKTTPGTDIELHTRQLPAGLYWAEIRNPQGKLLGSGKLVKE